MSQVPHLDQHDGRRDPQPGTGGGGQDRGGDDGHRGGDGVHQPHPAAVH